MHDSPNPANPFLSSKVAGRFFVGREPEIRGFENSLEALIRREPSHIYIAGVNGLGKTSCLAKLEDLARDREVLAVRVNLDQRASGHEQMKSMFETLITAADEVIELKAGAPRLMREWERGTDSVFRQSRDDRLRTDALKYDLRRLRDAVGPYVSGILVCIDLGERITSDALSALTSAVEPLPEYLIALTIRLPNDDGDPAGAGRQRLDEIAADAHRNLGASRAFGSAVGLGPFTPAQARECMLRRLEGRTISFEDALIDTIARVAERLPHRIVQYAHDVYNRAAQRGPEKASIAHFRQVFEATHRLEVGQARALRDRHASLDRHTLRELARHNGPMSPLDLAKAMHPQMPSDALEYFAAGIQGLLNRVTESSALCRKASGRFEVPDAVRRYALEICMEPE